MELFFRIKDGVGIISFSGGKILYDNVGDLKKALEYVLVNFPLKAGIAADFSNIDFVDSAGLGFLVNIKKILEARESEFALVHLSEGVRQIFQFTHVETYFLIFDTVESAVMKLKK